MLNDHLKIAYRTLLKQKVFSILNVLGLAIGIACCILIMHSIRFELSFDKMHTEETRLYRLNQRWFDGTYGTSMAAIAAPLLKKDFPEVKAVNRIIGSNGVTISYRQPGEEPLIFIEPGFFFADPNIFEVFDFNLIKGSPETVFSDPNSVVITESAAAKFFGDADAVGKVLTFEKEVEIIVTGIMEDHPANSSYRPDLIAPIALNEKLAGIKEYSSWWWPMTHTAVVLEEGTDADALNDRMQEWVAQYREPDVAEDLVPHLQPVDNIRLYGAGNEGEGTMEFVSVFSIVAILVLVIACFNFMNLSTARAMRRAREVGVRKVIGARRAQLIVQFLTESLLITFISLVLGLFIAELLLPVFIGLTGQELTIDYTDGYMYLGLLTILLVVGVISGSYPAFFLSKFRPVIVFKGMMHRQAGGGGIRKVLVALQFCISIALIIGTIVVYSQVNYMQSKSLGYSTSQLIQIPTRYETSVSEGYEAFKNELLQQAGVDGVTASNWETGSGYLYNIPTQLNGEGVEDPGVLYVDYDFFEVMDLEVKAGRGFSEDIADDGKRAFLINETAKGLLKGNSPWDTRVRISYGEYGKTIFEKEGDVIGVVDDFHAQHLRVPTRPMVITIEPNYQDSKGLNQMNTIYVRLTDGNMHNTMEAVEEIWYRHFPDRLFESEFVDDRMQQVYEKEASFGKTIGFFSILAIMVAALGLLGLSAYVTERRSKEVGVRKVMGASVKDIVLLLTREFTLLVIAGFALGAPLAWYIMREWLKDFPYRIDMALWIIVAGGLIALALAWLTVGYQSVKAACSDPVETLKDE